VLRRTENGTATDGSQPLDAANVSVKSPASGPVTVLSSATSNATCAAPNATCGVVMWMPGVVDDSSALASASAAAPALASETVIRAVSPPSSTSSPSQLLVICIVGAPAASLPLTSKLSTTPTNDTESRGGDTAQLPKPRRA